MGGIKIGQASQIGLGKWMDFRNAATEQNRQMQSKANYEIELDRILQDLEDKREAAQAPIKTAREVTDWQTKEKAGMVVKPEAKRTFEQEYELQHGYKPGQAPTVSDIPMGPDKPGFVQLLKTDRKTGQKYYDYEVDPMNPAKGGGTEPWQDRVARTDADRKEAQARADRKEKRRLDAEATAEWTKTRDEGLSGKTIRWGSKDEKTGVVTNGIPVRNNKGEVVKDKDGNIRYITTTAEKIDYLWRRFPNRKNILSKEDRKRLDAADTGMVPGGMGLIQNGSYSPGVGGDLRPRDKAPLPPGGLQDAQAVVFNAAIQAAQNGIARGGTYAEFLAEGLSRHWPEDQLKRAWVAAGGK